MKSPSWTLAPVTPEPVRVWLCQGFYDSQFYDCPALIVARSEAGSVLLQLPNGKQISPGVRGDRWIVTQAMALVASLKLRPTQVRDCAHTGRRQGPDVLNSIP